MVIYLIMGHINSLHGIKVIAIFTTKLMILKSSLMTFHLIVYPSARLIMMFTVGPIQQVTEFNPIVFTSPTTSLGQC